MTISAAIAGIHSPASVIIAEPPTCREIVSAIAAAAGCSTSSKPIPAPLFTAAGISKAFHLRKVLRDISFDLTTGEIVYLFGRNGCGKTTLLKILSGVMRPEHGVCRLNDLPLFTQDSRWRQRMAALGHRPGMYPVFSARENIRLSLDLRGQDWDGERFLHFMELYGLSGRDREPIQTFSEGMLQRLGLVRMELCEWDLGLLDEPASALDLDGADVLAATLTRWRDGGRTVIFTSHDVAWGVARADRAFHLQRGAIRDTVNNATESQVVQMLGSELK